MTNVIPHLKKAPSGQSNAPDFPATGYAREAFSQFVACHSKNKATAKVGPE